jgi:hypothetical protein
LPSWSSKNPDKHKEFKELYSGNPTEFSVIEWGGWNDAGRRKFVELQLKITKSRKENLDRHVKIDNECVARLQEKFAEMHKNDEKPAKKQKNDPHSIDRENDKTLEFLTEV